MDSTGGTPMSADIWELVNAGDVSAVMRRLRFEAGQLPVAELARIVEQAARLAGFEDLQNASSALAAEPEDPQALYDFGYACIDRGASYAAVPALSAALSLVPDAPMILGELVVALEEMGRHADAVAVLGEREATLRDWPERYLLVFNAVMAGDLPLAFQQFGRLSMPEDTDWLPARERVRRMLDRAAIARDVTALDHQDLRGWHFVLTGGVLSTLSPYGFAAGMTGRWAYVGDTYGSCLRGLHRLRLILDAAGRVPQAVSLLPDRSSRILGLAAAEVLGLPAEPFAAARPDTVVVAYDLTEVDEEILAGLRDRAPGQVLYEQATCWTEPPAVPADVSTLLRQAGTEPWGEVLRATPDGDAERTPADERPAEQVAADIVRADAGPDEGDGETPPDPDEALTRFAAAVTGQWLSGPRDRVPYSGPVPSSRFL
jgi:hypothetical protein